MKDLGAHVGSHMTNKSLIGRFRRYSQFPICLSKVTLFSSSATKTMLIVLVINWVTFIHQLAYLSVTTNRDQYLSSLSVQDGNCHLHLTRVSFRRTAATRCAVPSAWWKLRAERWCQAATSRGLRGETQGALGVFCAVTSRLSVCTPTEDSDWFAVQPLMFY